MTYYAVQYNMKGTWKFAYGSHGPRLYETLKKAKIAAGQLKGEYRYYDGGNLITCDTKVVEVNFTFKDIK